MTPKYGTFGQASVPEYLFFEDDELDQYEHDAYCQDCKQKCGNCFNKRGVPCLYTCCFGLGCCTFQVLGILFQWPFCIGVCGSAMGCIFCCTGCGMAMDCSRQAAEDLCHKPYTRVRAVKGLKEEKRKKKWRISSGQAVRDDQFPSLEALAAAAVVARGVSQEEADLIPETVRCKLPFEAKEEAVKRFIGS